MGKDNKSKTHLDFALEYIARGWHIFPIFYVRANGSCSCGSPKCDRKGKHPVPRNGFNAATTDEAQVRAWWRGDPQYNIGWCPSRSGLVGTDIDCGTDKKTGASKVGRQTWDALLADPRHKLPPALSVLTGGGGEHIYLKTTRDIQKSEGRVGKDIDVRGHGGYLILPPSNHESGKRYTFRDADNWQKAAEMMGDLPDWLAKLMDKPTVPSSVVTVRAATTPRTDQSELSADDPQERLTIAQAQELLKHIPPGPRDNWLKIGCIFRTVADWFGGDAGAFDVWDTWAENGDGYGGLTDQQRQWNSFSPTTAPPIALLKKLARENGWSPSADFEQHERTRWKAVAQRMLDELPDNAEPDSDEVAALFKVLQKLPEISREVFIKEKISKRFRSWGVQSIRNAVKQQKQQVNDSDVEIDEGMLVARAVLARHYDNGKLLIRGSDRSFWKYNGTHWEPIDNGDEVIGRQCTDEIDSLGPTRISKATIKNQAVDLLKSICAIEGDPLRLTQPPPRVINCRNCEVWINDDFTIELKDHNPNSYLRFCLDIDYDPSAKCPTFDEALLAIFQKSPQPEDMRRHLYEVCGYAIQPERYIKQFWLWTGDGDNGKTAVVKTLQLLVGTQSFYPADIRRIAHEYYIAHLKTKLILCDDDVNWNTVLPDGILKQLSEGKMVLGRDPRGRPVEFTSCVLPILLCNKYPITRDLSRGVQTRVHVIPFRHSFVETMPDGTPGDMDRELFKRIWKSELPGILNRAIEGLQRLRERGRYQEPEDCLRAKEEFLQKANPLPRFISEACITYKTDLDTIRQQARREALLLHFEPSCIDELLRYHSQGDGMEVVDKAIALAEAKAEASNERLGCKLTSFYTEFWQWSRNEGIQVAHKPTRADVENYLVNLGYAMTTVEHQKWVDGLKPIAQTDERPTDAM